MLWVTARLTLYLKAGCEPKARWPIRIFCAPLVLSYNARAPSAMMLIWAAAHFLLEAMQLCYLNSNELS